MKRNYLAIAMCGVMLSGNVLPALAEEIDAGTSVRSAPEVILETEGAVSFSTDQAATYGVVFEAVEEDKSIEETKSEVATSPTLLTANAPIEPAVETRTSLKVGDTFTVSRITYRVTNADTHEVTVESGSQFLKEINVPKVILYAPENIEFQVTGIDPGAFWGCNEVKTIVIPEGITSLSFDTFKGCDMAEEITLPASLTDFPTSGFKNLKTIHLAEGNTTFQLIAGCLFSADSKTLYLVPSGADMSNYQIPASTTTIAAAAFAFNQNISNIVIPDNVTSIEKNAFWGMAGLAHFELGENISDFGSHNLYQCPNLESVVLRGSLMLGNYNLNDCPKLTSITFDGEISGYGAYSMYNLPSLTEYVVTNSSYYKAIDGVLYNGDRLLRYPSAKDSTTFVIPEDVKEIGALAFNYLQNTNEIILPPNVKLSTQAFNYPSSNPISIYFRDADVLNMSSSKSGVFVGLPAGSMIYVKNQTALDSILANTNAINPAGSVGVEIKQILVKSITLDASIKEIEVTDQFSIKSSMEPYYASEDLLWSSSDEAVAKVDLSGQVTGAGKGSTIIMAYTESGASAVCKVTVRKAIGEVFKDVKVGQWFYDEVKYVYDNNIMTGLNDTTFGPYETLARAQFAVVLHRLSGEPKVAYTDRFKDVPDGQWYTNAVMWASSAGIITGYTSTGLFGTSDKINREQMAVMMYRYAKYQKYDTSKSADISKFKDATSVNGFAQEAMKWAVGTGIISGKDNGTRLDPQGNASRAESAIIVMRFVETYK